LSLILAQDDLIGKHANGALSGQDDLSINGSAAIRLYDLLTTLFELE
jgi:hypothetical protein